MKKSIVHNHKRGISFIISSIISIILLGYLLWFDLITSKTYPIAGIVYALILINECIICIKKKPSSNINSMNKRGNISYFIITITLLFIIDIYITLHQIEIGFITGTTFGLLLLLYHFGYRAVNKRPRK